MTDKKSLPNKDTQFDSSSELDEMFLLDDFDLDAKIAESDEINKLAAIDEDGEDEALLAFLTANMPEVEPSSDFTALVMQRIEQYEEVRAMLGLRWRRLLTVMAILGAVLFVVVSPLALTMLAFLDVVISSTVAIVGSLVLDMPSLQWGLIVAAFLLLGWSSWAIRYMAKHSYS